MIVQWAAAAWVLALVCGTPANAWTLPQVLHDRAGGPSVTDSTQVAVVRNVASSVIAFTGTNPAVNGQIGYGLMLGPDGYDPCSSGTDTFHRACLFGGGSYYHATSGSMAMPSGIILPNSEPSQSGPPGIVTHNWANKVYDGRIEIYPYGPAQTYDPWTQDVGGVHLDVRNGGSAGGNQFSLAGNIAVSPPIGTVPLPVTGQQGTGRVGGTVLSNPSAPVSDGRLQIDLFETDTNHLSSDGHIVGAFASLPSKGTQWTSGAVFDGSYIAFIEDKVRNNKIVTLLSISGNMTVDLDLDAACFGLAECEYALGGPQSFAGGFHPLPPSRILDTRTGLGHLGPGKVTQGEGASSDPNPFVRLLSQSNHEARVTGVGAVPEHGVSAVVLNATVVSPTASSHLTLFPKPARTSIFEDQSSFGGVPTASNLNFVPGQTVANLAVVKVGAGGVVRMFQSSGEVDVILDVVGYFDSGQGPGDGFVGVTPSRLMDTRSGIGGPARKFGPAEQRQLAVTGGVTTVPADATAVVVNLTATNTGASSHVTAWPAGLGKPEASNLNFGPGQTVPNLAMVRVGGGGQISIFNNAGDDDLIVDVVGYFVSSGGASFTSSSPTRILDSRSGVGLVGPWGPSTARDLAVRGSAGVPPDAVGVVMNTTVTQPSAPSHLTVWDQGAQRPEASNLNFVAGQTVPNLVVVKIGSSGQDSIFNNSGSVHVVGDVNGWFS